MNHATPRPAQLEWLLAGTLHLGTWLASAAIGLGLALALLDSRFSAPKLAILRDVRVRYRRDRAFNPSACRPRDRDAHRLPSATRLSL